MRCIIVSAAPFGVRKHGFGICHAYYQAIVATQLTRSAGEFSPALAHDQCYCHRTSAKGEWWAD